MDEDEDIGALPTGESIAALMAPGLTSADARSAYSKAQSAVEKQIGANLGLLNAAQQRLRTQRVGPSDAEKYFAIAAALGQPTRTGSFGETMGNLGTLLSKYSGAKREAESERESLLEKLGMQTGTEQLRLLQSNAAGAGQIMRAAATAEAAAAKAARPIFRGTETLKDGMIVAIYEDPRTGALTKQPVGQGEQKLTPTKLLSGGEQVFQVGGKLVLADGTPVAQIDKPERKLSATEIGLVDEKTKGLNAGKEALININRALELNPTALEGSLTGFRKSVGALFSSDDPAYVATEELDKMVIGSALTQMKTIFGGNPTEGERKILLDMQGSSNQPRAVRERIFQNARDAVQRRLEADAAILADIRSGGFGRVQPAAGAPSGGKRLKFNPKTGKIE
jgi:hypothetical protein